KHVPFEIKRVYYLYDVPAGGLRGGHAHIDLHQVIVAAKGSFDVILDDGINKQVLHLNSPEHGLHLVPGIWRELSGFSENAVCLVLASDYYRKESYIRDYHLFKTQKRYTHE
nr:WxcM-like domain-containing protein [Bacteroidota bacterium]